MILIFKETAKFRNWGKYWIAGDQVGWHYGGFLCYKQQNIDNWESERGKFYDSGDG